MTDAADMSPETSADAPVEATPQAPPPAPVVDFLVARVSKHGEPTQVQFAGRTIVAPVPTVEVELVDESGQHGSQTLRFKTADEQAYALATYRQGEVVKRAI